MKNSGEFISYAMSDDEALGAEGLIVGPVDIHLELSRVERMLILIEGVDPSHYSIDWYFYQFSRIIEVNEVDPRRLLIGIFQMIHSSSARYRYSEYIECLRQVFAKLQTQYDYRNNDLVFDGRSVGDYAWAWRKLIDCASFEMKAAEFLLLKRRRNRNIQATKDSVFSYADSLLKKYRRLLVIRLDLSYKAEYASFISEQEARADLSRLFANRRRNKNLIPDLVGYVCRIEWSARTRFHFHVMLFIDGDKRMKDAHIAYKTGLYWEQVITKGRGRFYSCNYSTQNYERPGIGMIHYGNPLEVDNLMNFALGYLVKNDQHILAHSVGHRKSVWTGQLPR